MPPKKKAAAFKEQTKRPNERAISKGSASKTTTSGPGETVDTADLTKELSTLRLQPGAQDAKTVTAATQTSTGQPNPLALMSEEEIKAADDKAYAWHAMMVQRLHEADDAMDNSFDWGEAFAESAPSKRPGCVDTACQTMLNSEPWIAGKLSAGDVDKIWKAYPLDR